uniref:Uncharacterized protein n=1 Tax=Arundo donax TaxID=35708 RepID=A0A0A9FN77_ARUDO
MKKKSGGHTGLLGRNQIMLRRQLLEKRSLFF